MRIACCVSTFVLIAACGSPPPPQEQTPAAGSSPAVTTTPRSPAAPTSRVEFPTAHGALAVDVELDATVAAGTTPRQVEVIGELPGRAVVVVDRYPSIPGGLSMCQAGEESFVRVIALAGAQPRLAHTAKAGSCLQNIELADPGLVWRADTGTLRIEWLANAAGMPETQEVVITADGRVTRR